MSPTRGDAQRSNLDSGVALRLAKASQYSAVQEHGGLNIAVDIAIDGLGHSDVECIGRDQEDSSGRDLAEAALAPSVSGSDERTGVCHTPKCASYEASKLWLNLTGSSKTVVQHFL